MILQAITPNAVPMVQQITKNNKSVLINEKAEQQKLKHPLNVFYLQKHQAQ